MADTSSNKKSGSTRVPSEKILGIAEQLGLKVETKAGWFLMYKDGERSKRLLVHTGKRGTNCVELVGFESPFAIAHPCPPAKTMTQMIDCNLDAKIILRNIHKTAKILATGAVAKAPESKPESSEAPAETEWTHAALAAQRDAA